MKRDIARWSQRKPRPPSVKNHELPPNQGRTPLGGSVVRTLRARQGRYFGFVTDKEAKGGCVGLVAIREERSDEHPGQKEKKAALSQRSLAININLIFQKIRIVSRHAHFPKS